MYQKTYSIYILLTRSTTLFSRLIHMIIRGEYTHASIGVDSPGGPFYSFGRVFPHLPFPGGMVKEGAGQGFFLKHPQIPCCLLSMPVSADVYCSLVNRLQYMYQQREKYRYNLLGTVCTLIRHPIHRKYHKFCSEFVAQILKESGAIDVVEPALAYPMDMLSLPGAEILYRGNVGHLAESEIYCI